MQAIMEPIFEIPYLIGVVVLGILTIRRAKGRRQFIVFGAMAIVLGCGDAFHLIPRMWALITTGTTTLPGQAAALGFGKLVTSLTMTVFYVMLDSVWRLRYRTEYTAGWTICIWVLAIVRIILCLMPQNQWLRPDASLQWGIYRNIPFLIMGLAITVRYFMQARRRQDTAFRHMWLAIALSFAFYIPVVLFADAYPLVGMLMIPKTCAYVWIVLMGFWDVGKVDNAFG